MSKIDDDRLLAFALGLDDDPELQAALAAQPLLQRRLDVIKAEVAQVQSDLQELVPSADAAYEQPVAERWRKLQPYLATPAARTASETGKADAIGAAAVAGNRGRPTWRRLLVPAVVLLAVLAVAVGVTVRLNGQGAGTSLSHRVAGSHSRSASTKAGTGAKAAQSSEQLFYDNSAAGSAGSPYYGQLNNGYGGELSGSGATKNAALPSASDYATVVVARAGFVVGGEQSYAVVRSLKGNAKAAVAGTLLAGTKQYAPLSRSARVQMSADSSHLLLASPLTEALAPVPLGALRVLYLQPTAGKPVRVLLLPVGTTAASVRLR